MSLRGTVLPALMVLIGIAILVRGLVDGAVVTGLVLGVLFCLAGGLRLWVERRA